jgi:hypothetical protein
MQRKEGSKTCQLSKSHQQAEQTVNACLSNYIAEQIVIEKTKNNGRVPWGFESKLLMEGQQTFSKISMQTVNNYVKKIEEQHLDKRVGSSILISNSTIAVSTITNEQPLCSINVHSADHNHSASSSSSSASSDSDDNSETSTASNDSTSRDDTTINFGGRPKGTTTSAGHNLKCRIEVATKETVDKLKQLREKMKKEGASKKRSFSKYYS